MKVIINADDFGHSENKTMAIAEAMEKGLVTSTTAMANMPWFDRAIELAKDRGFIDQVGLHFNLTEGRALTPEMRQCRIFCDIDGNFTASFHRDLKTRLILPSKVQSVIAIEAEAQINRYIDSGCTLKHLDSHHHVHTDFSVAQPLLKIARKYSFKSVRLSRTIGDHITIEKRIYKALFNPYLKSKLPSLVDEFTDYYGFAKSLDSIDINSRVEIMMHPQYINGILNDNARGMSDDAELWERLKDEGVVRCNYLTI